MNSSKPVVRVNHEPDTSQPILEAIQPMMELEWWTQQWPMSANPTARIMQQVWLENLSEVMLQRALFLLVLAEASRRLASFYLTGKSDPGRANTMAGHPGERMKRVAELPLDFRRRIWEVI
jgi:hypothetical protein